MPNTITDQRSDNNEISALVFYTDEITKLALCLDSVRPFVNKIVIIDLESITGLKEIAKQYKAQVISHPRVDIVEKVRNFGIGQITTPWTLILDPDERISLKLGNLLKEFADQDKYSAINIPRKNIFFNAWISHSNFWPDYQIRFFKTNCISWPETIHSYPQISGLVKTLPANEKIAIQHFNYDSWEEFFDKQNRYSTAAAQNQKTNSVVWQIIRNFLTRYIKHTGFLDGQMGIYICYALSIYFISTRIKQWEKKK